MADPLDPQGIADAIDAMERELNREAICDFFHAPMGWHGDENQDDFGGD